MNFRGLRILGVTPTPTHPTTAGNRARYCALLDRLQAGGATVRLIHVDHEAGDAAAMAVHWRGGFRRVPFTQPEPQHARWNRFARRVRNRLGIPLSERQDVDDWYDPAIAAAVREEVAEFRPHALLMLYLWFSAALDVVPPNVLRVLDAQDVFTDRAERMARAGVAQDWFSVPRREEARALDRFDLVLAIQEEEAQHYRALSSTPVVTVSHFLPTLARAPLTSAPKVLIVGSDNVVNIHGLRWFLAAVWPDVIAARPDARLVVVGRVGAHITPAPSLDIVGVLDDVRSAYERCALVINPLQGGTGLKIKGAEALAAGRVVISTVSAAIGLESAEGHGLVTCRSAPEMASSIVKLLNDAPELARLSEAAREFTVEWNARNAAAFDEVFSRLQDRLPVVTRVRQPV